MKLGKYAAYYYGAAEARKVLGIDPEQFQYWGREGRIKRVYLPGRKQPVYTKSEIDDLANQIEATVIAQGAEEKGYRKARLEDIEEEKQLACLAFGTGTLLVPREDFLRKNPDTDYHLYDQGKLVAFLNIFPLSHEILEQFIAGKVRGYEIDPNDIGQFTPGKPIECLIMDAVTIPSVPPSKRVAYSSRLVANFMRTLTDWGKQGVEITKLYSIGGTPAGQRILRSAGFKELREVGPGRIAFELDVATSDLKILRSYKANLEQWKQSQESTNSPKARSKKRISKSIENIVNVENV